MLIINRPKKVFMVIALVVPVIFAIIQIKISIKSPDNINNKKYYIIYLIPDGTTGAGDLICYDKDNIYYNNIHIEGKLPQKIITKGIYVLVSYGDYLAIYAHLNSAPSHLNIGQKINAGDYIGDTGNTGNSFGVHLHFGLAKNVPNNTYQNLVTNKYWADPMEWGGSNWWSYQD